jgi:hypothetical protein
MAFGIARIFFADRHAAGFFYVCLFVFFAGYPTASCSRLRNPTPFLSLFIATLDRACQFAKFLTCGRLETDRQAWFADATCRAIAYVENPWLGRIRTATMSRCELPACQCAQH